MAPAWIQITISVLTVAACGGLLLYALRAHDRCLKALDDEKVDSRVCDSHREHIRDRLDRGDSRFEQLRQDNKDITAQLAALSQAVSLLSQRMELWMSANHGGRGADEQ